jgi:hypothetical protein
VRLGLFAAATAAATALCGCSQSPSPARAPAVNGTWSHPRTLLACSGPSAPQVVFPQTTPFRRTGQGAIVLAGARSCREGQGVLVAGIDSHDVPGAPRHPRDFRGKPIVLLPALSSAATTKGQIVLIGAPPSAPRGARALLSEGPAAGAFGTPQALFGEASTFGLATAYLGDVAVASTAGGHSGVQVRLQRWFAAGFAAATDLGGTPARRRRALAVALDYRTDALAVWWQDGWLWARERRANGSLGPLQRFARASASVQLTVLISDDGRAIVAWIDPSRDGAELHLDISAPFMRLGSGTLLERLRWRAAAGSSAEPSVRLVRLSTESVLMAWTGTDAGHFVVRAAGIDLQGPRTTSTISSPSEDARLQALATGPRGDAVAVWSSAQAKSAIRAGSPRALVAARGVPSSRGVPRFDRPARIAPPGHYSAVGLAVDPSTDRALASWREDGGAIDWSVRTVGR